MEESKQNRKNPLTTIGINQEVAQELDELLKNKYPGMKRKEFVELAVAYFKRTGYDLSSCQVDYTPIERLANRLENSAKVIEQHNKGTEVVRQLLEAVREQTAKQLPAPDLIAHAVEEKERAEAKNQEQEKEIQRIKEENIRLCNKIKELEEWKEKAKTELRHCKGLFSSANENVLKELGM